MSSAAQTSKRSLIFQLLRLFVFSAITAALASNVFAAQTTLTWNPPVNAGGTLYAGVSGYKLDVGTASGVYTQNIDVGNTTTYTLNNLSDGLTYYFAATAYDSAGNSSGYSNEVSKLFPATYSLTATASTGGTITPVGSITASTATNGTSTVTSMTVTKGAAQSFSITPNTGYTIANVAVDGVSVGVVTSYTFSNVTTNHSMTVTFAAIPATYTLSASAGADGSITPAGTAAVTSGAGKAYTIAPAAGYKIADVKVDGASVGAIASYTFANVTANHTIAASFAVIPVTYTLSASAGAGGSITPSGSATVTRGASQAYTIAPAAGYKIASVTVDGNSVGAVASYAFSNINANHSIAVTFATSSTSIHWDDLTTAQVTGQDGTANYMLWSPIKADSTGTVTKLRINIRLFGAPTVIRLALYDMNGKKLTEGSVTATAAGYVQVPVAATAVSQGKTYYIVAQAASNMLYKFNCGSDVGGFAGPNTYSNGFPSSLPATIWGGKLLTAGMYIQ